jgi:hypothetical protein
MNPDQQLIQSAYEDAIKGLYVKLFEGYAEAGGGAAQQQQQADQRFTTGVALARMSRDRAIALLGQP